MPNDEEPPHPFEPDGRPRGILTKKDREFLINQEDYDAQTKRDKRYRIRKRIKNSLLDMSILEHFLSQEDKSKVIENLNEDYGEGQISNSLKFIYDGFSDIEGDFESILELAILNHKKGNNPNAIHHISVDIDIRTEDIDVEEAVSRFISGEATEKEFGFLLNKPEGLHQLADEIENSDHQATMQVREDAEPASIKSDDIRDIADELYSQPDE